MVKCVECDNFKDPICSVLKKRGHFAEGRLAFSPTENIVCPDFVEKKPVK